MGHSFPAPSPDCCRQTPPPDCCLQPAHVQRPGGAVLQGLRGVLSPERPGLGRGEGALRGVRGLSARQASSGRRPKGAQAWQQPPSERSLCLEPSLRPMLTPCILPPFPCAPTAQCVQRCCEKFMKHSARVGMRFAELSTQAETQMQQLVGQQQQQGQAGK